MGTSTAKMVFLWDPIQELREHGNVMYNSTKALQGEKDISKERGIKIKGEQIYEKTEIKSSYIKGCKFN